MFAQFRNCLTESAVLLPEVVVLLPEVAVLLPEVAVLLPEVGNVWQCLRPFGRQMGAKGVTGIKEQLFLDPCHPAGHSWALFGHQKGAKSDVSAPP